MPRVRVPQGELRDEIREAIFDSSDLGNADPTGTIQFFANVQGKLPSQTNLRQNSLLEATLSFRCQGITLNAQNIYSANINVLPLIMENGGVNLVVGEKSYWRGNATLVTGRLSQHSAVAADASAAPTLVNQVYQRFGDQAIQPTIWTGKHVVDIPPLQSFRVDYTIEGLTAAEVALATPAANTKVRLIMVMHGLKRRPVQ